MTIFPVDLCFQGSRHVSYLIQRQTDRQRQDRDRQRHGEKEIERFTIVVSRL